MNRCAVYHVWPYPGDAPPYANLRVPTVVSIATLRAVSDIPVIVLDCSETPQDWAHFPQKLGFEVRFVAPALGEYRNTLPGWRYLSRLIDLPAHVEADQVLYVDSDVFWFKNPFPLLCDPNTMCLNPKNSGYFYYNSRSARVRKFFRLFEHYVHAAVNSEAVRSLMKKSIEWDGWYGVWDEMVLSFMSEQNPGLLTPLPVEEHAITSQLVGADPSKVKMFHANGLGVPNPNPKCEGERQHCRGLLGLAVEEFYEKVRGVLDPTDLKMIYTQAETLYCSKHRLSLLQNLERLRLCKGSDDSYSFSKLLVRPTMLI